MAHEFARYMTSTHRDPDWTSLTTLQHDCYMALLCSEDISWAGVVPYAPLRFSGFASDLTARKITRTWQELDEAGLLVVDKGSAEILARTFVKHDGVIKKPNITKAFCTAYLKVRSDKIRSALDTELWKLYQAAPDLAGWVPFEECLPLLFQDLQTVKVGS